MEQLDLDAPTFEVAQHTATYVLTEPVQPLLAREELLACQVRTLDSQMQTLCYDNYSRFIQATDAIRNIGVSVDCNAGNVQQLHTSVARAGMTAAAVEGACGTLRDAVVEKLRMKRLLHRLDAVIKLPTTLRTMIHAGRYRSAITAYLQAYTILHQQSDGWESLQRIEEECYHITADLLVAVRQKLRQWSGHPTTTCSTPATANTNDEEEETEEEKEDEVSPPRSSDCAATVVLHEDPLPPPPEFPDTVASIFECAGTPVLILNHIRDHIPASSSTATTTHPTPPTTTTTTSNKRGSQVVHLKTELSTEQCEEMAFAACLRFLERCLETHQLDGQDARVGLFESSSRSLPAASSFVPSSGEDEREEEKTKGGGHRWIPTKVLDSILEAAALYNVTFPPSPPTARTGLELEEKEEEPGDGRRRKLSHFVATAFDAFLHHVRAALLEQAAYNAYPKDLQRSFSSLRGEIAAVTTKESNQADEDDGTTHDNNQNADADDNDDDEGQESVDQAYEHVSNATALLLESVHHFSSGLTLPEVALEERVAARFVEQTVALSDAMVRRRVDHKFLILRFRVLQNCLAPFCRNAGVTETEEAATAAAPERIHRLVQMASVALSDSSQLLDDTVRSILSCSSSKESPTLKIAVEHSTVQFAIWLACALETLAGCELSNSKHIVDVLPDRTENTTSVDSGSSSTQLIYPIALGGSGSCDNVDNDLSELVDNCMWELVEELDALGTKTTKLDLTLAIAEMCRLSERSVMDDINQSIATHTGSTNKHRNAQNDSLFATTAVSEEDSNDTTKQTPASMRFRLAASRALALYAVNRGNDGGEVLSSHLFELSRHNFDDGSSDETTGPRFGTWSLLTVVKSASFDCADLFGGSKRAGPVPDTLDDEYVSLTMARQKQAFRSNLIGDVERLFEEKVQIYPHPFETIDFQRNLVVFVALKVAFTSLRENVRLVRFSKEGYRQLLIDVEFLKFMIPHYVSDDESSHHGDGSNTVNVLVTILSEIIKSAKARCDSSATLQDDCLEINQARASIRNFMAINCGEDGLIRRFTIADDDTV